MLVLAAMLIGCVVAAVMQTGNQVVPAPLVMVVRTVYGVGIFAIIVKAGWLVKVDKVSLMCRDIDVSARLAILAHMKIFVLVRCYF